MNEMVDISLSFPTVLFSFAFIVVVLFWLVVLSGMLSTDVLDTDIDANNHASVIGILPVTKAAKTVPATVVLSLWIVLAWFGSVAGTVLSREFDFPGLAAVLVSLLVLVAASVAAWILTLFIVWPLGRLYGHAPAASRHDFVGKTCVIRTQTVGNDFGQAEITSTDGSSAIIPVRIDENGDGEHLVAGDTALIYEYDHRGEHFLVAPFDLAIEPDPPVR
ncbi:MAG TPA: hypothetical protein H9881_10030 [Candidatus Stackebrandtia excrementipullorum]|nr:hypothetical protein [Candidatus Stackebrandtia excrementipullorum]